MSSRAWLWAGWVTVAGLVGCGDDGAESTGASEGATMGGSTSAGATGTGATGTGESGTGAASASGSSTAGETVGSVECGLGGMSGELYVTGSFTIDMAGGLGDVTPTGVFDPLVGKEVCFGVTFAATNQADEPMAQRRFLIEDAVIVTDDGTGVASSTFAPATLGALYLRRMDFSPYALIVTLGSGAPMAEENFSFELVCLAPEPFELDAGGLPIFQSMVCEAGNAALRRFGAMNEVTDIASGSARFGLHVP